MKIWLMNHYASDMFRDRGGRHYWFARELNKREYEATVFCANIFYNGTGSIDTKGETSITQSVDGIPFVFVKTVPAQGNGIGRIINMGLFYSNLFPSARKYVKENGKPDVIIASSVHPLTMVAGIKIAGKLNIPCICEIRDLWPEAIFSFGKVKENSLLGRILVKGEHWIYKKADALIFTKEGDTDYLKEHGWTTAQGGDIDLGLCHYINNGVDVAGFEENVKTETLSDADLLNPEKFNVTYAGAIRTLNNVGNLLDTAAILKSKGGYDDVQFLIYGESVQLPELKKRVEDEKLTNVKIKGFIDRKYIPFILSKSDICVLNFSQKMRNWTRGNSCNKLFEYMASGKPVISTVHTGYSIIERYQCGVELDNDTPDALAEEIMHFHDMKPEERSLIGANGKAGAKDFDVTVLVDKLIDVIKEVI